jgi:predicted transposase YbfD/YdcC
LCLAQEGVRGKGKEIEGVKALLETQTFKGCIVTMDVLGCQTEIAQKMLERSGDYLLAVKENQPSLAEALRAFFDEGETSGYGRFLSVSRRETVEKDHGRIETQRVLWITNLSWMNAPLRERWPELSGVSMLERTRETKDKISRERACFIGSKGVTCAEAFATSARRVKGANTGESKIPCTGCLMSLAARTAVGFARDMPRRTSPPYANSRWRCCVEMRLTPNAACAPDEKPPSVSRSP